jgi:hypothetical protein
VTSVAALATAALAGLFTAVAARSAPGHRHARTVVQPAVTTVPTKMTVPPPPSLPRDSGSSSVTPIAPAPAPAPTPQQPVVVSGGS